MCTECHAHIDVRPLQLADQWGRGTTYFLASWDVSLSLFLSGGWLSRSLREDVVAFMSKFDEQNPPQGGVGGLLGDSAVNRVRTRGTVVDLRNEGPGIAPLDNAQSSPHPPPKATDVGSASGALRLHLSAGVDGAGPRGFGDDVGVSPSGGNNLTRTPTPSDSRGYSRETRRGFVAPGSEAPTEY